MGSACVKAARRMLVKLTKGLIFPLGCVLAIISPWLGFFPERLPAEKTDALKIAKERENEVEPQTAKEWIQELVKTK